MRVLFVVIEYDSAEQTNDLVASIYRAKSHFGSQSSAESDMHDDALNLDIVIVNNFIRNNVWPCDFLADPSVRLDVINAEQNNGYFGGVELVQDLLAERKAYDYLIYSNPDLVVSLNFFESLRQVICAESVSVIAPRIVDARNNVDQNPMYINEPSKLKFYFLRRIFSNQISFVLYDLISQAKGYATTFLKWRGPVSPAEIFAPHGALIIFCNQFFFESLPRHFCFLYGEELLIAKESQKQDLTIVYDNSVEVHHRPHTTLNKVPSSRLRRYYFEMIDAYIRRYVSG